MGRWRRRTRHRHRYEQQNSSSVVSVGDGEGAASTGDNETTRSSSSTDGKDTAGVGGGVGYSSGSKGGAAVAKSASSTRSSSSSKRSNNFNSLDRERIESYLAEYKRLAEATALSRRGRTVVGDDEAGPGTMRSSVDVEEGTHHVYSLATGGTAKPGFTSAAGGTGDGSSIAAATAAIDDDDIIWTIGGHKFPPLTVENVSRPYLLLPPTLGSKERKAVHAMCVNVGLYHESVGDREHAHDSSLDPHGSSRSSQHTTPRRCLVSIYSDGFDYVPGGGLSRPSSIPVRRCLPWYYRNHDVSKWVVTHEGVAGECGAFNREQQQQEDDDNGKDQEEVTYDFSEYFARRIRSDNAVATATHTGDPSNGADHDRSDGKESSSSFAAGDDDTGAGAAPWSTTVTIRESSWRKPPQDKPNELDTAADDDDDDRSDVKESSSSFAAGDDGTGAGEAPTTTTEILRESSGREPPQKKPIGFDTAADDDSDETAPMASTPTSGSRWGALNDSESMVQEITKMGRERVEKLFDQPGKCLRDELDVIDFEQLENEDLSCLPPLMECPCLLVDSKEKMSRCVQEIEESNPSEIGFDVEMYNPSKYTGLTCLLQIATPMKDYVIDVFANGVWDSVSLLAPIFADPSVVKIGHHIGSMDVPALHRDFGIFVVNAFDTYEAAWLLRLKKLGLAAVCEHYKLPTSDYYARLKAQYQNTDWRKRPLTEHMIQYARHDIHFLIPLRRMLTRDLTSPGLWDASSWDRNEEARLIAKALAATLRKGQTFGDEEDVVSMNSSFSAGQSSTASDDEGYFSCDSQGGALDIEGTAKKSIFGAKELRMDASLMKVISQSQDRCRSLWTHRNEPTMRHESVLSAMKEGLGRGWSAKHTLLYEELVYWRKAVARQVGTMPGLVCPTELLVDVVRKRPTSLPLLRKLSYFLPELLEGIDCDYAQQMFELVNRASPIGNGVSKSDGERLSFHSVTFERSTVIEETTGTASTVIKAVTEENESNDLPNLERRNVPVLRNTHAPELHANYASDDPDRTEDMNDVLTDPGASQRMKDEPDDDDLGNRPRARNKEISVLAFKIVTVVAIGALAVLLVRKRRR